MNSITVMFTGFIGAYLVYLAVVGKGKAYNDEAIKDEYKSKYQKYLRLFCAILGPVCLANAGVDYIAAGNPAPMLRTVSLALYITSTIGIILLFVMFFKMRKPIKK